LGSIGALPGIQKSGEALSFCNMMSAMRLVFIFVLTAAGLWAQHSYTQSDVEDGARLYRSSCVGCHGPDGDALSTADLSHGTFRRAASDEELIALIRAGVPGTAMGPNDSINDFQAVTIVAYLRSFATAPARHSALVADPAHGKRLFETKGGCLACHRVKSEGSRLGPNLTDIGSTRRTVELERALVNPNAEAAPQNRFVRVVTQDGTALTGRLLNIDTFSVQLIDSSENLRSFVRADLREAAVLGKSPMLSYKDKLSPQELADLVGYLASLKGIDKQ
jgi:putative heme-binding domain-containing protein